MVSPSRTATTGPTKPANAMPGRAKTVEGRPQGVALSVLLLARHASVFHTTVDHHVPPVTAEALRQLQQLCLEFGIIFCVPFPQKGSGKPPALST